ncbi:ABC transporter permease [Patescibacteria group bacterium]|nr:ABC transporter permease [Patescibacteria group bacterium]MBU4367589.1 ABC transporter permease [Patescibacteria group bacterium]MBU4461629.1 ABC transporter permease [Patescibacteria group bacterium]MCG2699527.1 ABC transporter permease [Candidatus Parcubacteria bacterium]
MNVTQIFAIAKKEIKLNFRFKWNYFGDAILQPLRFVILFSVVYSGFFLSGAKEIGGITQTNFISFLILGSLVHTFFSFGFNIFKTKFINEKYWQTILSFLVAPVHRLKLVIGIGLSELPRLGIILVIFLGIAYLITPIAFAKLLLVILIIFLAFLGTLGVSLIIGAFSLANEDTLFAFSYIYWGWTFLSCLYYPLSSLPRFLHLAVRINPIYHCIEFIRELWLGLSGTTAVHLCFIIPFAILAPVIGVYLFNKIIKKIGITGY